MAVLKQDQVPTVATGERGEMTEKQGSYPIKWAKLYCPGCGRFLCDYAIVWGKIKVPCRNCKKSVTVSITPEDGDQDDIEASVKRGDTYVSAPIDNPGDQE